MDAQSVSNQATATGTTPDGDDVSDLSDDNSNLENDPTDTNLPETARYRSSRPLCSTMRMAMVLLSWARRSATASR
ncbi:hypothetical protein [Nonlabens agnitus]